MNGLDLSDLRNDIALLVERTLATDRIVNVSAIAAKLRRKHEHLNIALEDVESLVLQRAQALTLPILFDGADIEPYEN
jgi:hypothetical protein